MFEHRIILDGEMLVWDPETKKTQAFGNLKTAALSGLFAARPSFERLD